jgi:hypothetical protein
VALFDVGFVVVVFVAAEAKAAAARRVRALIFIMTIIHHARWAVSTFVEGQAEAVGLEGGKRPINRLIPVPGLEARA